MNWPYTTPKEHERRTYYKACENHQTAGDTSGKQPHNRCANPLMEQQWGLKFNASEVLGLEKAVKEATGKELAGHLYPGRSHLVPSPESSYSMNKDDLSGSHLTYSTEQTVLVVILCTANQ